MARIRTTGELIILELGEKYELHVYKERLYIWTTGLILSLLTYLGYAKNAALTRNNFYIWLFMLLAVYAILFIIYPCKYLRKVTRAAIAVF